MSGRSTGEFDFPGIPTFPADVKTVPLHTLSLSKLCGGDEKEVDRLWQICQDLGFFYLDVRGANDSVRGINGDDLLAKADDLFGLAKVIYDMPLEEKMKYDMTSKNTYFGYKAKGGGYIDKEGRTDWNEMYNISKDDVLELSEPWPAPPAIPPRRSVLRSFMRMSHAIVILILGHLNSLLKLPDGTLQELHRLRAHSGDQVRLLKSPPQPSISSDPSKAWLSEHTDFGSVTVLFNKLGGLQVKTDAEGGGQEWRYVKPMNGCAIVNLGDAMAMFSRGILRSSVHRVVEPPGRQRDYDRYSLVYFSRPEDDVTLKPLKGSSLIDKLKPENEDDSKGENAKDWILRRALGRQIPGKFEESGGTEEWRSEKQDNAVPVS